MYRWWRPHDGTSLPDDRLRTDGGEEDAGGEDGDSQRPDEATDPKEEDDADDGVADDAAPENVEVTDPGEAEPAEPKWDRPDPEDIPEFEIRADDPAAGRGGGNVGAGGHERPGGGGLGDEDTDPTAGMPNTARSPGESRIRREGTEGYIAALELCARLPDDVRLPEEAADLVPAAVEAELESDVQSFAAAEFDNPAPHVDTLSFVEADDEVWLRLRIGVPPDAFDDLDPDAIRSYALQELEGMF